MIDKMPHPQKSPLAPRATSFFGSELAIETRGLSRDFVRYQKTQAPGWKTFWQRERVSSSALFPTDLAIRKGELVGLVGANGAGKTTLIKLLSGLIHPSAGEARVLGSIPHLRQRAHLKKIGLLLGQKNQLWWDLSALESFRLLIEIYSLHRTEAFDRIKSMASQLLCENRLEFPLRTLSLGERMKMELIGSLLHQPEVLFLDEPTLGLDLVAQKAIRSFLKNYQKERTTTILLTSHYMDDIAELASRLILMARGQLVYDGSIQDFTRKSKPSLQVSGSWKEPLTQNLSIGAWTWSMNEAQNPDWNIEIQESDLPDLHLALSKAPPLTRLQIQKGNFEESIHEFLKSESRLL